MPPHASICSGGSGRARTDSGWALRAEASHFTRATVVPWAPSRIRPSPGGPPVAGEDPGGTPSPSRRWSGLAPGRGARRGRFLVVERAGRAAVGEDHGEQCAHVPRGSPGYSPGRWKWRGPCGLEPSHGAFADQLGLEPSHGAFADQLPLGRPAPRRCRTGGGRPRSWCRSARPGRREHPQAHFQTTSTSPFAQSSQAAVESRPVVADAGGEVVVGGWPASSMPAACRASVVFPGTAPRRCWERRLESRASDHNAFDLVDRHRVRRPVVELRRLR